ncbi:MAG: multifunctional CCA addition/repair protein [Gammaproteobacteria bacterium]
MDLEHKSKCYLVGGAVRDGLLGVEAGDRDWVVIGTSPEEMIKDGFIPVGRDFPVFLHPTSKEEYALARRERKIAPGYRGFETETGSDVTLEEDLSRRDLTINAMAQDADGNLVDPHGGVRDLKAKILRHVSPAFGEDPLRVLRVARFAARYQHRGFTVAPETLDLMKQISASGELQALTPERVWQETLTALNEHSPVEFFSVLDSCNGLGEVFPELNALKGVPQRADFHPEGDVYQHTMMAVDAASVLTRDARVRFAALVHDLGKSATPPAEWPKHHGHERRGVSLVRNLCDRLRVPTEYRDLACMVTAEHLLMHRLEELRPETILELLNRLDGFRRPDRIRPFILACHADAQGRREGASIDYPSDPLLEAYLEAARSVDLRALAESPLNAEAKKRFVFDQRMQAIAQVQNQRK